MKLSKYQIIIDSLINDITNKKYQPNELLPSEGEMQTIFNASKTPIRQALNELENRGYIKKVKGKGSIVINKKITEDWINMTGFRDNYDLNWDLVSSKSINLSLKYDPEKAKLFATDTENVIYLERQRFLDGSPIFYLEHYLSMKIPFDLFEQNINFSSIQQLLKEHLNIQLVQAVDSLEAIVTDEYISNKLDVPQNTPILKGTRISKDSKGTVYNIDIFYTRTDKWKYKSNFKI
ncbi:GntR family transcriptional regulator [Ureibacillus sp. NPDC094379]